MVDSFFFLYRGVNILNLLEKGHFVTAWVPTSQHIGQKIGLLHDLVTWYRINYAGTLITPWDFQNKGKSDWIVTSSSVLHTALFASQHNLFCTMWPDPAKGLMAIYCCLLSDLAFQWQRGWWWPFCDQYWPHCFCCVNQIVVMLIRGILMTKNEKGLYQNKFTSSLAAILRPYWNIERTIDIAPLGKKRVLFFFLSLKEVLDWWLCLLSLCIA